MLASYTVKKAKPRLIFKKKRVFKTSLPLKLWLLLYCKWSMVVPQRQCAHRYTLQISSVRNMGTTWTRARRLVRDGTL